LKFTHHNNIHLNRLSSGFTTLQPELRKPLEMHTANSEVLKSRKKCMVYVWGCNENSQLGLGPVTDHKKEPVHLEFFKRKKPIYVSCGSHHSCVLTASGSIYTWGKGNDGQLGLGPNLKRGFIPQRVAPIKKKKALIVHCGNTSTAAIVADKTSSVYIWGHFETGEESFQGDYPNPEPVPFFAKKKVLSIACGVSHSACVVQNPGGDTEVYTWGSGDKGKLGNNCERSERDPYLVEALRGARSSTVVCGSDFTVALSKRGDVYAWGSGDSGRCGSGSCDPILVPICLPAFNNIEIIEVSAGSDHVAAVSVSGKLYTWGYGSNGRLGHGAEADVVLPTVVEALANEKIVHVSCGGHHTAAVTDNGLLYTFGWNHYGQLGHSSSSDSNGCSLLPVLVEVLKSNFVVQVSCGEQHTVALVQY